MHMNCYKSACYSSKSMTSLKSPIFTKNMRQVMQSLCQHQLMASE